MPMSQRTDVLRLPPSVTRLVVLGDPHGDVPGLEAVLAKESAPRTAFVSVGDNVGYGDGDQSSALVEALRSRGIPSVYGNHEDWIRPGGTLSITSSPGLPAQLSMPAYLWSRELPLAIRVESELAPWLTVLVTHSILRDGEWDWVTDENVRDFLRDVRGAAVVVCGHTHRPAIHVVTRRRSRVRRLDVSPGSDQSEEVKIERGVRYVLDAGSTSRAERISRDYRGPRDRGSYAVIDFAAQVGSVRSVVKPAAC